MEGKGVYIMPSGKIYDGEFKEGGAHGRGICKFTNGSSWEGKFVNGECQGIGKYIS